jgi:hypothetical protein
MGICPRRGVIWEASAMRHNALRYQSAAVIYDVLKPDAIRAQAILEIDDMISTDKCSVKHYRCLNSSGGLVHQ